MVQEVKPQADAMSIVLLFVVKTPVAFTVAEQEIPGALLLRTLRRSSWEAWVGPRSNKPPHEIAPCSAGPLPSMVESASLRVPPSTKCRRPCCCGLCRIPRARTRLWKR